MNLVVDLGVCVCGAEVVGELGSGRVGIVGRGAGRGGFYIGADTLQYYCDSIQHTYRRGAHSLNLTVPDILILSNKMREMFAQ